MGQRLAPRAEIIPNFPITPQTELIKEIASWIASGKMDADFLAMESEHRIYCALLPPTRQQEHVSSSSHKFIGTDADWVRWCL